MAGDVLDRTEPFIPRNYQDANRRVRIAAGQGIVQMPNGLPANAGDVVLLTEDEFAELDATDIGTIVLDEGKQVGEAGDTFVVQEAGDLAIITTPTIDLVDVDDGDVLSFAPGLVGDIVSVRAIVTEAVTTGAKTTDLNLEIGTTDVDAGVVQVTSAAATPLGAAIDGSAITADNTLAADSVVTVEASSTTAHAEGQIVLEILVDIS